MLFNRVTLQGKVSQVKFSNWIRVLSDRNHQLIKFEEEKRFGLKKKKKQFCYYEKREINTFLNFPCKISLCQIMHTDILFSFLKHSLSLVSVLPWSVLSLDSSLKTSSLFLLKSSTSLVSKLLLRVQDSNILEPSPDGFRSKLGYCICLICFFFVDIGSDDEKRLFSLSTTIFCKVIPEVSP